MFVRCEEASLLTREKLYYNNNNNNTFNWYKTESLRNNCKTVEINNIIDKQT